MVRAYLWIASIALAGCNQIFVLDDDAVFQLPDVFDDLVVTAPCP